MGVAVLERAPSRVSAAARSAGVVATLTAPVASSCGSGGRGTKELRGSMIIGGVLGAGGGVGAGAAVTAACGNLANSWNFGLPVSGNDPRANHPAKTRKAAIDV